MLFRQVRYQSPAISVESLILLVMYVIHTRTTCASRGVNSNLAYQGKFVLDNRERKVKLKGGWGKNGSFSKFRIFVNAVNNIYTISMHDFNYK